MLAEDQLHSIQQLCKDIPPDVLQDFIGRMDQEYFRRVEPSAIAQHVRLAAQLTPEHLCELAIAEQRGEHFDLTIVAYDYFSEFAMICGLLSAFGLNIEEGQIYTFGDAASVQPLRSAYGAPHRRPKTRPRRASGGVSWRGVLFHQQAAPRPFHEFPGDVCAPVRGP